jgi:hypothetical protein
MNIKELHARISKGLEPMRVVPVVNDVPQCDRLSRRVGAAVAGKVATYGDVCSGAAAHTATGGDAGLVSSKTTRQVESWIVESVKKQSSQREISFDSALMAARRVKRLKKSVWASGHLHGISSDGFRASRVWFVTLTYRGVHDWSAKHMSKAIEGFRHWCRDRRIPCKYTWVAELQSRGAVHYHLLAWLPVGYRMPKWDRRTCTPSGKRTACWWPHGMTNTQVAKAGVGYLMKYLSKLGELTKFPKGLRLYGVGGLDKQARAVRSWLNLPEWVKLSHGVGEVVRKKFGLLVRATGEVLDPAYSCRVVSGGLLITPLRELPARFHDGAYSSFPRVVA